MYSIEKTVSWEMGHRLKDHPGKCANLHGHSYKALFQFSSEELNTQNMVFDFYHFAAIKEYIDKYLDHAFMFNSCDPVCNAVLSVESVVSKLFFAPCEPTAEYIARLLYGTAFKWLKDQKEKFENVVELDSVTVWETASCSATYSGDSNGK